MNITGGLGAWAWGVQFQRMDPLGVLKVSAALSAAPFLTLKRFFMEEEYIQPSP